jgi:hypothetical protein
MVMASNLKTCSLCKIEKDISEFSPSYEKLRARCRECDNSTYKKKKADNEILQNEIGEESRTCDKCHIEKTNNDFHKTASAGLFAKICKDCKNHSRRKKKASADIEEITEEVETLKLVPDGRTCTKCKIEKEINEFAHSNGRPRGDCKDCCNNVFREKRIIEKLALEKALAEIQIIKTETSQTCLLCKEEKEYSMYDIVYGIMRIHCRMCYENLPDIIPISIKNELKKERSRERYANMSKEQKEDRKSGRQEYYINNKETINDKQAEYRKNNPEKERVRHAKFYQENKETIHIYRNKFYDENPSKKLMNSIRSRLRSMYVSRKECYDLIGCDMDFLERWFTFHFELDKNKGMNFLNHGEIWHIDHVLPCRIFDPTIDSHKEQCFHWSNLSPLLTKENLSKSGKISEEHISIQNTRLEKFCKQENISLFQIEIPTKTQDSSIEGDNQQSVSECDSECDSDTKSECEPECDSGSESECEPECDSGSESECELECDSDTKSECEPECNSGSESECDSEL